MWSNTVVLPKTADLCMRANFIQRLPPILAIQSLFSTRVAIRRHIYNRECRYRRHPSIYHMSTTPTCRYTVVNLLNRCLVIEITIFLVSLSRCTRLADDLDPRMDHPGDQGLDLDHQKNWRQDLISGWSRLPEVHTVIEIMISVTECSHLVIEIMISITGWYTQSMIC